MLSVSSLVVPKRVWAYQYVQSVPHPGSLLGRVACPLLGVSRRRLPHWPQSFFKLLLRFCLCFGVDWPGHGFPPSMAFEQPGDRTFMHLVTYLRFKGTFDFIRRRNLDRKSVV